MPVRATDNPFDSKAIKCECQAEDQWRAVVHDALDAVHCAINHSEMKEIV